MSKEYVLVEFLNISGNDGEKMGDIVPVSWLHRTNKEYIYLLKFMSLSYTVRKIEFFESILSIDYYKYYQ